jgi:uncharacterized glyoxalase superfamily protein PhnB
MKIIKTSTCVATDQVNEVTAFFVTHFGAKVTFDCGWYVNLELGNPETTLQFMSPQPGQTALNPTGLMLNFSVQDVDAEHQALVASGIQPCMPIEDHPWGDRGFAVLAPGGLMVYLFSDREPDEAFRKYYVQRPR